MLSGGNKNGIEQSSKKLNGIEQKVENKNKVKPNVKRELRKDPKFLNFFLKLYHTNLNFQGENIHIEGKKKKKNSFVNSFPFFRL